jgi:hypothetical protein
VHESAFWYLIGAAINPVVRLPKGIFKFSAVMPEIVMNKTVMKTLGPFAIGIDVAKRAVECVGVPVPGLRIT